MHSISTHPRFPGGKGGQVTRNRRETEGSGFCGGKGKETDQFRFLLWMETYRDGPRPTFNEEEESLGLKGNGMSSENEFCFRPNVIIPFGSSAGITSVSQEFFWKTGELRGICSNLPKQQKKHKGEVNPTPQLFRCCPPPPPPPLFFSLPRCRNFGYHRILPWKRGEPFHSLSSPFIGSGGTKPACLLQPPSPPSSLGYKISCWNFPPPLFSSFHSSAVRTVWRC